MTREGQSYIGQDLGQSTEGESNGLDHSAYTSEHDLRTSLSTLYQFIRRFNWSDPNLMAKKLPNGELKNPRAELPRAERKYMQAIGGLVELVKQIPPKQRVGRTPEVAQAKNDAFHIGYQILMYQHPETFPIQMSHEARRTWDIIGSNNRLRSKFEAARAKISASYLMSTRQSLSPFEKITLFDQKNTGNSEVATALRPEEYSFLRNQIVARIRENYRPGPEFSTFLLHLLHICAHESEKKINPQELSSKQVFEHILIPVILEYSTELTTFAQKNDSEEWINEAIQELSRLTTLSASIEKEKTSLDPSPRQKQ